MQAVWQVVAVLKCPCKSSAAFVERARMLQLSSSKQKS